MKADELLRARGIPFSVMTTTKVLLLIADGKNNNMFTYCPRLGVMLGLGDFDDNPSAYTPKCFQLFRASKDELLKMKSDWEQTAKLNTRFGKAQRKEWPANSPMPRLPDRDEPTFPDAPYEEDMRAFAGLCDQIESGNTEAA